MSFWSKIVEITDLSEEDLKFLKDLEERVHHNLTSKFTPNMSGRSIDVPIDNYHGKISKDEMDQVLSIVSNSNELILIPWQSNFGFFPCYEVLSISSPYPGIQKRQSLLRFSSNHKFRKNMILKK